ncbi:hypothetical protein GCM10007940_14330 [Portibacter lacus]|uniref:HTH araC/xylS-type domain-containing protein n=2 Tax=Portibacter lacus TaxID=1099794 RepID=A0AA37SQK4_9BACT|nr:hypothetical protein GCM10007940_14330 [Portibacter lacus]
MVNVVLNKGEIGIKTKAAAEPIDHADQLLLKIKSKMEEEKLYLNPKLKLNDLADAVELNRNMVSRLLNEEYLHGFSNFVNEMRVNEAMKLIHLRSDLSLEGIGYEAGFNSKSSFFSAFKKISGLTPAQFKKNMQTA